jgi:hypothetical protein
VRLGVVHVDAPLANGRAAFAARPHSRARSCAHGLRLRIRLHLNQLAYQPADRLWRAGRCAGCKAEQQQMLPPGRQTTTPQTLAFFSQRVLATTPLPYSSS